MPVFRVEKGIPPPLANFIENLDSCFQQIWIPALAGTKKPEELFRKFAKGPAKKSKTF